MGIGLKNVAAVAMHDAVFCGWPVGQLEGQECSEETENTRRQAGRGLSSRSPILVLAGCFQIKRIHVHPGASLSLQSHHQRSEHWVVVAGTAKVTVVDKEPVDLHSPRSCSPGGKPRAVPDGAERGADRFVSGGE